MTAYTNTFQTPIGFISTAVNEQKDVVAVWFAADRNDQSLCCELTKQGWDCVADPAKTALVDDQLSEYFAGARRTFDLPLAARGSAFQQQVWQELLKIPFGETRSYGDLAKILGQPNASRAVGRANATNPIAIIVPCHRVIGANGSLTGYAGGLSNKQKLLDFESQQSGLFAIG